MNKRIKSYLPVLGHLILGIIILVSTQRLKLPAWLNVSVVVFAAFLVLNLAYSYLFKLNKDLKVFWSLKKMPFMLLAMVAGILIGVSPAAIGLLTGQLDPSEVSWDTQISVSSIALTFLIISWEELWFRGLFLNYCHKHVSAVELSLIMGSLFMLIHLLNPEMDLVKTGPTLFFAGALLTALYFYYKTIWVPLGVHFGNNITDSILTTNNDTDMLFGQDGYVGAIVLAAVFCLYLIRLKKVNKKQIKTEYYQTVGPEPRYANRD